MKVSKIVMLAGMLLAGVSAPAHAGDTCDAVGQRIYPLFIDVAVKDIGVDHDAALKMWPRDKAVAEIIGGIKGSPDFVDGGTCEILIVMPDAALRKFLAAYMAEYFNGEGA